MSLNNSQFGDYLHCIYPNELEIKDTSDAQKLVSYLTFTSNSTTEEDLTQNSTTNVAASIFQ
jgi:hypothetical protein